jgi:hypothetical protein
VISLIQSYYTFEKGFSIPALQRDEDNPMASQLGSLDVGETWRTENKLEEEDAEVLVALLYAHLQLEYKSDSGPFFPPQVQYLMDLNRCGRILLEGRGITSIPLLYMASNLGTDEYLFVPQRRKECQCHLLLSPEWTCLGRSW